MQDHSPEAPTPAAKPPAPAGTTGLRAFAQRTGAFLRQDVWDIEPVALPRLRRLFVRFVRIGQLVLRGFKQDECMLHASSLTFTTLLAIVPVLALALSMARVFGGDDLARDQLKALAREWLSAPAPSWIPMPNGNGSPAAVHPPAPADLPEPAAARQQAGMPAAPSDPTGPAAPAATGADTPVPPEAAVISVARIEKLIDTGFERINSLNFKALGGLGLVFLLGTVIGVLGQVEAAFNRVWGVTEQRPLHRKFTDYLSVLIVVPFLITAASSIPAAGVLSRFASGEGMPLALPAAGIRLVRTLSSILLLTLSFAFLLRFLPNTRVHPRSGLLGGFVTALLVLIWLRICAAFQVGVARNSVFFGSFAMVPILLSWVYVNWEILLFGAEVSFAVQNADTYRMEQGASKASPRTRLIAAVDLLATAARELTRGDGLLRVGEYAARRRISVRLVNDVVHELVQHNLLVETAQEPGVFALRRDVAALTVGEVFRILLDSGLPARALGFACPPQSPLCEPLDASLAAMLPQRLRDLDPAVFQTPATHA